MRTLVYKRTHKGDPDRHGHFGNEDCMGRVRRLAFDAVIGIGGIGGEACAAGIAGKLNWIGVGARTEPGRDMRGPLVTFDHFVLFEDRGPDLDKVAPALARRMYSRGAPRFVLYDVSEIERAEIRRLLKMAKTASPSKGAPLRGRTKRGRCGCDSRRC